MKHPSILSLLTLALTTPAFAQIPQLVPFDRTLDLMVVDSSFDGIWRLADLNQDGDYLDGGEITTFYSDTIGSIALTNPNCIAVSPLGTTYIGDSTADVIVALVDLDADGSANGAGEHTVFFDSATNASGIVMPSIQGLTVAASSEVFAAVSNTSSSGVDMIVRLFDSNADGDANDLGEATIYCQIPNASTGVGDSIPTMVVAGPDTRLYYTDVGATGAVTKGVWRLDDLNFDGDCNDPGEVNLFWTPPAPGNAFYWSLAVDRDGYFYVTDHGNETIWRGRDGNGDNVIDTTEEQLFYQTASSTWWDIVLRDDGVVLVCEDQSPDRITALVDLNNDGDALDPGESSNVYADGLTAFDLRPRGAAFLRAPELAVVPNTVMIGNASTVFVTAGKPGDLVILGASFGLQPPSPLAPFGEAELNPALVVSFGLSFANPSAQTSTPISIPNNPSVVGNYGFQALAGDLFRPFLSNGGLLTVTP